MHAIAAFRGKKREFESYLVGIRSGKVVDLNWYRTKRKAASRAADEISSTPSIA